MITLNIYDNSTINFAPETEEEEILQNVRTICTTPKYSVPMDREFGVDMEALDLPTPAAMAKMQREIIQAVRKYEPRARIEEVTIIKPNEQKTGFNIQLRMSLNDD